ncbi:MAG: hypothetical protein H7Y13_11870 [Sphingobacteriaceae bacterium]|nr:hypothetical protein [Sphingobacteriaceae bacterium]
MEVAHNAVKICEEIEGFAYKYLSADEIAVIVDVDVLEILDRTTVYGKAFLKGKLLRKAKFNDNVIRLSDQLSSPAQAIELKIAEAAALGGINA